jgi:hypothetical protein
MVNRAAQAALSDIKSAGCIPNVIYLVNTV